VGYGLAFGFELFVQVLKKTKIQCIICVYLSQFMKGPKLTMVQIIGFVEDKKTFQHWYL
jgi:hypothetical protein